MKKILIFSLAYYPDKKLVSGAESAIKDTTERIEDIEFHMITHLFDPQAPREEQIGHVHVYRVGFGNAYLSKILFVPLAALKARSLERKLHIDAYWCMMTYMVFPLVLGRMIGLRAPHVISFQDGDPYEKVFERWFIRPIAPLLDYGIRTASVIQAITHYLAEWPRRRGYKGPIEIIYDGANPKDLKDVPSESDVEKVRQELGKKPGDVFLVNTARLVFQKGADTTIRALPLLPAYVKLVLVGGGDEEVMLKNLGQELGLQDRVIFTGQVDRTVVTLYRRACDIFVGPSRSEGQGHAFNSAMASRRPVIATREGGLAEFVFNGDEPGQQKTAWAVTKDSPEEIAAAVMDILGNPERTAEVVERAHAMTLEKFDWDKIAVAMRSKVFAPVVG